MEAPYTTRRQSTLMLQRRRSSVSLPPGFLKGLWKPRKSITVTRAVADPHASSPLGQPPLGPTNGPTPPRIPLRELSVNEDHASPSFFKTRYQRALDAAAMCHDPGPSMEDAPADGASPLACLLEPPAVCASPMVRRSSNSPMPTQRCGRLWQRRFTAVTGPSASPLGLPSLSPGPLPADPLAMLSPQPPMGGPPGLGQRRPTIVGHVARELAPEFRSPPDPAADSSPACPPTPSAPVSSPAALADPMRYISPPPLPAPTRPRPQPHHRPFRFGTPEHCDCPLSPVPTGFASNIVPSPPPRLSPQPFCTPSPPSGLHPGGRARSNWFDSGPHSRRQMSEVIRAIAGEEVEEMELACTAALVRPGPRIALRTPRRPTLGVHGPSAADRPPAVPASDAAVEVEGAAGVKGSDSRKDLAREPPCFGRLVTSYELGDAPTPEDECPGLPDLRESPTHGSRKRGRPPSPPGATAPPLAITCPWLEDPAVGPSD